MTDYLINTERTFTPQDNTLTSYVWKVDGIQESTLQIFKRTFTTLGNHTITLEGSNSCGSCTPQSTTINIVESITPSGLGMGVVVIALGLGALYALMSGKK